MTPDLIELCAVLACTVFTGAAVYISAVEHPARLAWGPEIAVAEWTPSYKRATVMQAPLALAAGLLGIARFVLGGGMLWIAAALLILAVIPFTLIVIQPTNHRLLDPGRDRRSDETRHLLETWGRLHGVRTGLSVVASILFIWAATH